VTDQISHGNMAAGGRTGNEQPSIQGKAACRILLLQTGMAANQQQNERSETVNMT
jgi:hypothetical protein